jgi:hypothetical protein
MMFGGFFLHDEYVHFDYFVDWTSAINCSFSWMLMTRGRRSGLISKGVTSWDETGQCCHWRIKPVFPFRELWCMLVSVCFHNPVTYAQRLRDLCSACSECVHTLYLGLWSSHPKDVRVTGPK